MKDLDRVTRGYEYCLLQEIAIVVPSPGDATQLRRFVCQLEEELKASVLETISTWTNTDIALELQKSVSLGNMLDQLVNMPEVEKVEKETLATSAFSSLPKRF